MSQSVRLLPVLGAVAFGALALKTVAIADGAGTLAVRTADNADLAASSNTTDADLPSLISSDNEDTETTDETEADAPASCPGGFDIAEQTGLSQYEIQVLRSLSERRQTLDEREDTIDIREQTLAAAELRLDEQIAELEALETNIGLLLDELDKKSEAELQSLVKIYESMKAKDAASIFNTLEDELMLRIAHRMKPANMAAVLAAMDRRRATVLTRLMAEKAELPETAAELRERTDGT